MEVAPTLKPHTRRRFFLPAIRPLRSKTTAVPRPTPGSALRFGAHVGSFSLCMSTRPPSPLLLHSPVRSNRSSEDPSQNAPRAESVYNLSTASRYLRLHRRNIITRQNHGTASERPVRVRTRRVRIRCIGVHCYSREGFPVKSLPSKYPKALPHHHHHEKAEETRTHISVVDERIVGTVG